MMPSAPGARTTSPRCHSACRWASASPIAKVIWCTSNWRLKMTSTMSRAELGGAPARGQRIGEAVGVVVAQLADARVQAAKRPPVRGQDQHVFRQRLVLVERGEIQRERIGLGLDVEHADVGGDARQHHVAGDQHAGVFAVERDVLGRVAEAGDDTPAVRADRDDLAVHDAAVLLGHARHQRAVVVLAVADALDGLGVGQAVAGEMARGGLAPALDAPVPPTSMRAKA